ncbi:MAG TPA: glycosyltransferase, partial [Coleofasciculaceae cyanobacterium]
MFEISPHIAIFLGFFGGGGVERVLMLLAHSFTEQGIKVDLVLSRADSPHLWRVPSSVRIVDFAAPRLSACLPDLVRYLKREQPRVLLSAGHYTNEVALWAKRLSGVSTRVIVSEHNQLSLSTKSMGRVKRRLIPWFIRLFYPWADGIVTVSHGVAEDLANTTGLDRERIQVIYNPVIHPELWERANEPLTHPWFAPGEPPVILGVGKLEAQKDFPTLIHAFSRVQQIRPARLMILGWGPDRPKLEAL